MGGLDALRPLLIRRIHDREATISSPPAAGEGTLAVAFVLALGLALATGACAPEEPDPDDRPGSGASTAAVVDSVFPVDEEIRRFQATLPAEATDLSGGAPSRGTLVARFVRAVESADTTGLVRLAMTRSEFGFLYYPTSRYTRPPYRLGPALAWYQNRNVSTRGLTRLLRRYGGEDMGFVSYACPDRAEVEGENRFWHGCTVRHAAGADTVDIRLFGSIWERDGRYKLVGYANAF